ncbi:MAG TPA: hypothetical protein VMF58_13560 [Rhizomicrobium sp.]|nr:hypothetical protein [Rhizomicrobium sp.]
MKYDPRICSLMVQSESLQLQDRIEEVSRSTRITLANAAEQVRAELMRRGNARDDNLARVAEMLEMIAYGVSDNFFFDATLQFN